MKRIAVLITCYNRVDTTLECLRRLFAQELPGGYSFDVWLVDDASPDKTGEKVKAAYPQVNVIQGTGKLFWCKGMRLAWDKAAEAYDYDFYLWLNDDVMLSPNALLCMLKDHEMLDKSGKDNSVVVGAFTDSESGSEISYSAGGADGCDIVPNGTAPQRAYRYFGGNCVLIPKSVYVTVGPICSLYHHAVGDFDYARMLEKHHIPFYVTSQVCGWCTKSNKQRIYLKNIPLTKRIKLLFMPNGYHVGDSFIYHLRHDGLFRGVLSAIHIICRVLTATDHRRTVNG